LIELIDNPEIKQNLFRESFTSTVVMVKLVQSQKLDWWVQKVREGNATISRHDLVFTWLCRSRSLREWEGQDNLSIIEELFAEEPHDENRFALAKLLIANSEFREMFAKESNIDVLLRLIDLRDNVAGKQELMIQFVRQVNKPIIFQSCTLNKILQFSSDQAPAESANAIKVELLDSLLSQRSETTHLNVADYIKLSRDLSKFQLKASVEKVLHQTQFVNWLLKPDNFRPFLDWAATLPGDSRNVIAIRLTQFLGSRSGAAVPAIENPLTLDFFWRRIDSFADGEAERQADACTDLGPRCAFSQRTAKAAL